VAVAEPRPTLTVATFNVHMGVDGWGRPFDVVAQCGRLDADLLVLQESWAPDGDGPSTAARVAERWGYQVVAEVALAHARLYAPLPTASARWAPWPNRLRRALRLDQERTGAGYADRPFVRGQWGVAVLSRVPTHDVDVLLLGRLRRDPARRAVIRCRTRLGGREVTVLGTHMSHITQGSHVQYRRLAAALPSPDTAAVLLGDMNLWGPPVNAYMSGWRRAVTGRTWPAHRPHSQLDHVLVTPPITVVDAGIAADSGSDHRPVRVTLSLGEAAPAGIGVASPW
jgi:endonuclease/exonuclease/phosphatase family metal-dependent hydrolase